MSLPPYVYAPLSGHAHTRIIELEPASNPWEPLHCSIKEVDINLYSDYSAISYTWGEPNFTEELIVARTHAFPITSNLRDALTRFRHENKRRCLWADAVCINQKDDEEKSKQIASMSLIYRRAASVLVWLGNYPEAAANLKSLKRLSQAIDQRLRHSQDFDAQVLKHLGVLSTVPWFSRRWIIQEVVHNPETVLHCSSEDLDWVRFVLLITGIPTVPPEFASIRTMADLWKAWVLASADEAENPEEELLGYLNDFEKFQCADARDRVFALAGLIRSPREPYPRYLQDCGLTAEEVYTQFALNAWPNLSDDAMERFMWGAIFARSNDDDTQQNQTLPWWAPDSRQPRLREPLAVALGGQFRSVYRERVKNLNLGQEDGLCIIDTEDPLDVSNFNLIVTETWDTTPVSDRPSDVAKWLICTYHSWTDHVLAEAKGELSITDVKSSFLSCMAECWDFSFGRLQNGANAYNSLELVRLVFSNILDNEDDYFGEEEASILSDMTHQLRPRRVFSWTLRKPSARHALDFTNLPQFGIGPDHIRQGDLIRSLYRGPSQDWVIVPPYSIAARQLAGGRYRVVGDCYLGKLRRNKSSIPTWA